MIVSIDEAKEWLAVEHTEHDGMIARVISAAERYIKNATGHEFDSANELAQQLCLALVSDMYDNRTFGGPSENIRPIIGSMVQQLMYCYMSVPTGLKATVENNIINLIWNASNDPNLAGYKVYKDSVVIGTIVTNSFKTNFVAGTYQVSAYDLHGNESNLSKGVIV